MSARSTPSRSTPSRSTPSLVGTVVEVDVGAVAHGGHCVARLGGPGGRVVFVRHALPGERVRVRITEDTGGAFCRGDAVEILAVSPDRVEAPCPYAGPGRCGGCDWQHVRAEAQRALKAAVIDEQFRRLAGIETAVRVAEVPGGTLGWRTRISYAVDPGGRAGLHRHRSQEVQPIDRCRLGAPGVGDAPELGRRWAGAAGLDVAVDDDARCRVSVSRPVPVSAPRAGGRRPHRGTRPALRREPVRGPDTLVHRVEGREYRVGADGFWQVHPQAASVLCAAVLATRDSWVGVSVLDLYAGAGLFTAALAEAVGPTGRVLGVEGARGAGRDAIGNVARWPWAQMRTAPVTAETVRGLGPADVIVLDPPRTGAGRDVMTAVLAGAAHAVVYVACDPAALARDVRTALDAGWAVARLSAYDLFPMTAHVECVAVLTPRSPGPSAAPSIVAAS